MSSKDYSKLWARVDRELEEGRHWRAKEILGGNIGSQGYVPELYERYGHLLLQLGDLVEAGKYLFLCGVRKAEYQEAITLFLSRHLPNGLCNAFPRAAQRDTLASYPAAVAKELAELGVLPKAKLSPPAMKPGSQSRLRKTLAEFGTGIYWLCIIVLALIGFTQVARIVKRWLGP